jgi:hypothetical protein
MEQTFTKQSWYWERKVEAKEQGGYLEIPFELPEQTEWLHVSYSYERLGEGP